MNQRTQSFQARLASRGEAAPASRASCLAAKPPSRLASRARPRRAHGFSLIEIALSIAIIGMGLIAILGVMPTLLTSSRGAIENTELAMGAQNSVDEDFVAWRTPQNLSGSVGQTILGTYTGASLKATSVITYAPATNIVLGKEFKERNGTGEPLLQTVRYTYSWPPGAARPQTFTFITEICATTNIVMQ